MYQTVRATVHRGRIRLVDKLKLPENTVLLVTVMADVPPQSLSLGEHLERGLQDVARRRVTKVRTPKQLKQHLDKVFDQA